jgi:hypothetical protein
VTGGGFWSEDDDDEEVEGEVEDGAEVGGEGEGTPKRAVKSGLFEGTVLVGGTPPLEVEVEVEPVEEDAIVEVENGKFEDVEEVDGIAGGVVVGKGVTPPPNPILFCNCCIA